LDAVVEHADTLVIAHADTGDGRILTPIRQGQTVINLGDAAGPKTGAALVSGPVADLTCTDKRPALKSAAIVE
jgi:hypothetical protein